MDEEFKSAYRSMGLMHEETGLSLHEYCPKAHFCWKVIAADRRPKGSASHISRPWIGDDYERLRLLVVGINLNGDGGFDELVSLAKRAQTDIGLGKKQINFDTKGYRGTSLWHRVGCYAALFAESAGLTNVKYDDDGAPAKDSASRAYDFIAYTNHVKCSPASYNSKPTYSMWTECGRYILREEIALLRPQYSLLLGAENYRRFVCQIADSPGQPMQSCDRVKRAMVRIGSLPLQLYGVPHPTRGGASFSIIQELRSALASH